MSREQCGAGVRLRVFDPEEKAQLILPQRTHYSGDTTLDNTQKPELTHAHSPHSTLTFRTVKIFNYLFKNVQLWRTPSAHVTKANLKGCGQALVMPIRHGETTLIAALVQARRGYSAQDQSDYVKSAGGRLATKEENTLVAGTLLRTALDKNREPSVYDLTFYQEYVTGYVLDDSGHVSIVENVVVKNGSLSRPVRSCALFIFERGRTSAPPLRLADSEELVAHHTHSE